MLKRALKCVAIVLAAILVIVGGYVAYVFIAYHRLPDTDVIAERSEADATALETGKAYDIVTWNLGFGAYSDDYSFFMDGGTESRAYSKEAVLQNIGHAIDVVRAENVDFTLLQEVDIGSTRSYHVDEAAMLEEALGGCVQFAQNYDSPYLFYPILRPHGASRSGLLTLSDS